MYPQPQIFKKKKGKLALLALLTPLLIWGGYLMLDDEPLIGWIGIILFGLAELGLLVQLLLPNAYYLKITEEGFEVKSLFRTQLTKWDEIKGLRKGSLQGNKMIMYDYTGKHRKWKNGKKVAKFLAGKEGALLSDYTIKTDELLALMEEYKRRSREG